ITRPRRASWGPGDITCWSEGGAECGLREYERKYRSIKTVEQDLPKALNPLPLLYQNYWKPNGADEEHPFASFEEFFNKWWEKHLKEVSEFIKKYFWGCSLEFVKLGLEARLYRTAVSIWTQFHLAYLWKKASHLKVEASWELDAKGVDALVHIDNNLKVALQVKKESYRTEAGKSNRFSQKKEPMPIIEVPYTLLPVEELQDKAKRARKEENVQKYLLWAKVAKELKHLPNGFVVFQASYVRKIEAFLLEKGSSLSGTIPWEMVAKEILSNDLHGPETAQGPLPPGEVDAEDKP
ncbi:TaqI family restriction endonuclease, partial [Thermus sp.]|uniref:TaqI family restriction endonuclease n=1 Tax=Thermus sp. TaxID=275 RepID=UPI00262436D4